MDGTVRGGGGNGNAAGIALAKESKPRLIPDAELPCA
jgi:hypothetical protein